MCECFSREARCSGREAALQPRVLQAARVDPRGEARVEFLQDCAACLPLLVPRGKIRQVPVQRGSFGPNPLACGASLWNRSPARAQPQLQLHPHCGCSPVLNSRVMNLTLLLLLTLSESTNYISHCSPARSL